MLFTIWLMLLLSAPMVWGQFPAVCNTPNNLDAKECCPDACSGRGECVNITNEVVRSWDLANQSVVEILREGLPGASWPVDVRYQWPLLIFERVCNCSPGWGGYNCDRCDFGYVLQGGMCVEQSGNYLVREDFSQLDPTKQLEYIMIVNASKNEREEKWAVVVGEPARTDHRQTFELQNVSTYDMFVTLHTLAGREQDNDNCDSILDVTIDFAHQSSAFLTWHRYYLLIVESELRRVAKEMGIMNFTLPYWNWQTGIDQTIFRRDLLGIYEPSYHTGEMNDRRYNVDGVLFNNDWPTVCDQHYREQNLDCSDVRSLCNVNQDLDRNYPLQRGFRKSNDKPFLPADDSIVMALAADDNNDQYGFRNRLEGFVDLCPGNSPQCIRYLNEAEERTHNNLHNAVHIFLGGHMRIVPSASNDPIFFLHHANIDRQFESWLRKSGGNPPSGYSMTETGGHPGHNLNDYLVPFFPLKTNADMYKRSSELGFRYDLLQRTDNLPSDSSLMTCPIDSTCARGGYHEVSSTPTPTNPASSSTSTSTASTDPDSSNSVYHIQLYLLLFGVATASILM